MLYLRHLDADAILDTLDLELAHYDPMRERAEVKLYYSIMQSEQYLPPYAIPVDHLYGFCEVPSRYWIHTCLKRICVFVKYNPESPVQRFVWKQPDGNDIIETLEIEQDSLVFLEIRGNILSYDNEKLLFIECQDTLKHPITVLFTDNYGLVQSINLETGQWNTSDTINGTFRSISGEIEYPLEKIPSNSLNIGLSGIKKELRDFVSGIVNSRIHSVLLPGLEDGFFIKSIDTSLFDATLDASSWTKQYDMTGVLSFNTRDLPLLSEQYGDLNIHDQY